MLRLDCTLAFQTSLANLWHIFISEEIPLPMCDQLLEQEST